MPGFIGLNFHVHATGGIQQVDGSERDRPAINGIVNRLLWYDDSQSTGGKTACVERVYLGCGTSETRSTDATRTVECGAAECSFATRSR